MLRILDGSAFPPLTQSGSIHLYLCFDADVVFKVYGADLWPFGPGDCLAHLKSERWRAGVFIPQARRLVIRAR